MKKSTIVRTTKKLDFKFKALVTKDAGSDECIIEGYANTSSKDRVGDVVLPSAFAKSLPGFMANPICLLQHNWSDVAGKILEAKVVDKGLYVKARISDTRPDLKTLVREGCLSTFSIGYNELDADYDEETKTKVVRDLELLEISIVSIPANAEAKFTVVDTAKKPDETAVTEAQAAPTPIETAEPKSLSLEEFTSIVKSATGEDLDAESLTAVCEFYNEKKDNLMKLNRKQLLDSLKTVIKDASATVVAPEAQKDDSAPAPAESPAAPEASDPSKEISAKLDAIAKACADILETLKAESAPESAPAPEAPAPEAAAPKDAPAPDTEKSIEEMTETELAAFESDIDSQLSELE